MGFQGTTSSWQLGSIAAFILLGSATAYPWYWLDQHLHPGSCGKHPQTAFGQHLPPVQDKQLSFMLKLEGGSAFISPSAPMCPGNRYKVTASWTMFQHALLTTTVGQWAVPPTPCLTSTYIVNAANTITDTLVLPCTAAGNVTLQVTYSGINAAYQWNNVTYTISPACAAATCPQPPPAAAMPPLSLAAQPPPVTGAAKPPPKKASPPPKKISPPPKKKSPPPRKKSPPPKKRTPPTKKASPPPKMG